MLLMGSALIQLPTCCCLLAETTVSTLLQVQSLLDEGVYDNERYKEGGWVTDLWYEDQVLQALKDRTGGKPDIIRGVRPCLLPLPSPALLHSISTGP